MAVNTTDIAQGLAGLPSQETMLAPQGIDKVDTTISGPGGSEEPAKLTEGEIIFSVPSIIAAGKGDYNAGAKMLLEIHEMLREQSKGFIDGQGLANAGLDDDSTPSEDGTFITEEDGLGV
jgi:hypothetical protein